MRLNLLRSGGTMRYDAEGNAIWYVVDEDRPLAEKYDAIFHGTIVDCARYIRDREQGVRDDEHPYCAIHGQSFDPERGCAGCVEAEWVEASSHPSYAGE